MYSNIPCAFAQLPDDVLEFGSGTSLQTPKEVQISFVIQFKFNSTFWRRKIRLDAQVDQGGFQRSIAMICFPTRLDSQSVNSRICEVGYYLHGLQLRCFLESRQLLRPLVRNGKVPLLSLFLLFRLHLSIHFKTFPRRYAPGLPIWPRELVVPGHSGLLPRTRNPR